MNDISIRKAGINDLEDIRRLNNELFELEINNFDDTLVSGWPYTEEGLDYYKDLINNYYVYVAIKDDVVVGYLAGSILEYSHIKHKYAELNNMCINNNYRGLGIGTKLIDQFKSDMKNNNITEIRVTASYKNENAKKFYELKGFYEFETTYKMDI